MLSCILIVCMKVLFIGGSGNISSACTVEALAAGHEVFHFNRGRTSVYSFGEKINLIRGNNDSPEERERIRALEPFDVVVNFICFTPLQIKQDIDFFKDIF